MAAHLLRHLLPRSPLPKSISQPPLPTAGGGAHLPPPLPLHHLAASIHSLFHSFSSLSPTKEPPTHPRDPKGTAEPGVGVQGLGPRQDMESVLSNHSEDLLHAWLCHLTPCHSPESRRPPLDCSQKEKLSRGVGDAPGMHGTQTLPCKCSQVQVVLEVYQPCPLCKPQFAHLTNGENSICQACLVGD